MEIKNIVNLTPHAITIVNAETMEVQMVIPPSGAVARVSSSTEQIGMIAGIPLTETVYGKVEGLPEWKEDTICIVSSLVAQRCKNRGDVFIPNESVRDDQGRIIGCKSLGRI